MALPIGTLAPDFTLSCKSRDGLKRIRLSDQFANSNVILLFVPMAFTPVCTGELCCVTQDLSIYSSLRAVVYGVSGDNPFAQEAWAQKEQIGVTLLSDYDHMVAKAYGVAYGSFLPEMGLGMSGVPKRSAFLIDRRGYIRHAESSDDPKQVPDFSKVRRALESLQ
ncbi:MAG: redoxin domain-containing protein [Candidatus Xiphinematobacter sp.]|nr:MAG: redoxin domain-containing protein [Candidatus Xiphinematobacter sp.]QQY09918.1 MAG: redoxin domain-containing protein [Candidatus Xiphinematobacter sp.]QQY10653.1 MAG: redoxin domain-containing protein [Candidatus Xiphinematobacter sp.]QQY11396.1 MAG: redoxin domain-containing protein [Candidatus Xiphinematobacter sp.]